jgi:ABC-2 type transport system ATP-binding protein
MRQRLKLAVALVGEPDLLVLDEPSSGLDPAGIRLLRELVFEECDRGAAVFFSSHILEQVETVCDRVGILVDGRLRMSGKVEALKANTGPAVELDVDVERCSPQLVTAVDAIDAVSACDVSKTGACESTLSLSLSNASAKAEALRTIEAHTTVVDFTAAEHSLESAFEAQVAEAEP